MVRSLRPLAFASYVLSSSLDGSAGQIDPSPKSSSWRRFQQPRELASALRHGLQPGAAHFVDSGTPPGKAREVSSDAPPSRERDDRERGRRDRIVPDLLRRFLDAGVEKLSDGPESLKQVLSELRLPKEAIQLLVSQLEDAKKDVTRVLAREVRDFLERASLADELTKLLSGLTLEIKTQIRFVPNEGSVGGIRPRVQAKVGVQTASEPPTGAPESKQPGSPHSSDPIRQPSSVPCASDAAATEQERPK